MKKLAALCLLALPTAAMAQAPAPATVVTAAQVQALSAQAAAAQGGKPNSLKPIIAAPGYTLNLEHRVARAPAAVHPTDAEWMIVLDGAGTFTVGGKLAPASGGDTILANVGLVPRIVFVDPAGLVAGFAWGSSGAVDLLEVGPAKTETLQGPTYVLACRPDGSAVDAQDAGLAPGQYDAWPFATAVRKDVQHADGTAEVPPATPVLVVGEPHRVTFAG